MQDISHPQQVRRQSRLQFSRGEAFSRCPREPHWFRISSQLILDCVRPRGLVSAALLGSAERCSYDIDEKGG